VDLAQKMGAKVYHFPWINDFSAAKNFAIEQAKGNWIVFLDADEYFSREDAEKMKVLLTNVENNPALRKNCITLKCACVQLDDEGKPFMVLEQERVFRNRPDIRYVGKIHEMLSTMGQGVYNAPELSIMHTGYSKSAYKEGNKAARNLTMLREELANKPGDPDLLCYIADSLRIEPTAENLDEAETLYDEAIHSDKPLIPYLKKSAYNFLIVRNAGREGNRAETIRLCEKALAEFPNEPDFNYYYGDFLYEKKAYRPAWEHYQKCEESLKSKQISSSFYIATKPIDLFFHMLLTAKALGDKVNMVRYAALLLKEDRYQQGILVPFLRDLKGTGTDASDEDIFLLLEKLYDFSHIKDKLFLLRCAKEAENAVLAVMLLGAISEEEWKWIRQEEGEEKADISVVT
jgi:glycosyltransferase involved in cell wall biosynthesis